MDLCLPLSNQIGKVTERIRGFSLSAKRKVELMGSGAFRESALPLNSSEAQIPFGIRWAAPAKSLVAIVP